MAEPLMGTESAAGAIQRVKYTHDALIDMIIANPAVSQGQLATQFGINVTQAWRYAQGAAWPDADVVDHIVAIANGDISVLAMHQRRSRWLREKRGGRRVPVTVYHGGPPDERQPPDGGT